MSVASAITNPVTTYMRIIKYSEGDNISLNKAFDELVNLITVGIQSKNIDDVSEGLAEKVFEIRLDILSWIVDNFNNMNEVIDTVNEKISDMDYAPIHSDLFDCTQKVLSTSNGIIAKALEDSSADSFAEIRNSIQNNRPNYKSLQFLKSHPQSKYLVKLIDESLKIEVGTIISFLILSEKINLDRKRINQELIPFLNRTIERFGAYSIFTKSWKPDESDDSKIAYKMQILADTIRMNNGMPPLILENEENLEDVALGLAMEAVSADKECVDVDEFLKELRG